MTAPEPTVRPVAYEVTHLPEGHPSPEAYAIRVEYRGHGRWAVLRGRSCLGPAGWDWEPSQPKFRTQEWIAAHRYDLATALELARDAAPRVTANGPAVALADGPQMARRRGRPRGGGSTRRGVPGESGQGPPQGAARGRGDVPGH